MGVKNLQFLKTVFIYSFTAFGGPQGHLGMMVKTFVQKRKDITEEELTEYTAFCQILPGPTSTQTVTLIAYKLGGIPLAAITLLLWVLPASLIMGAFSFILTFLDTKSIQTNLFSYVQPMSVGFIFYAGIKMMQANCKHIATYSIMIGGFLCVLFIRSPWVFPILLILSGTLSNFSNRRIPSSNEKPQKINWYNLWLFASLFIIAGFLSEMARTHHWKYSHIFNIFENFYRFGSIVFGGGQALMPMMLIQFSRGLHPLIKAEDLTTGFGLVQAVPGPVFSICSFVGGMAMSSYGPIWQIAGCITATVAIFLPNTLLLFFFFPLYQNLKHHVIIFRALEGINAVIVGIIIASGILLFQTISPGNLFNWSNMVVALLTFCILYFTKIPSPIIVIACLLLGIGKALS